MIKIAALISADLSDDHPERRADYFEYEEQFSKLIPAFADHGMTLTTHVWEGFASKAKAYRAVLPLMVWDYFDGKREKFINEMKAVAAQTRLFNPAHMLIWNSDKSYLENLTQKGAPIIPTLTIKSVTQATVLPLFEQFDTDKLVIKPEIGAGAWRQILYTKGTPFPLPHLCPPGRALVQPFLPSVMKRGEVSLLYFNGKLSHGVLKTPKAGDYRIQSIYGGGEALYHPSAEDCAVADTVLSTLDSVPLYARIDLMQGRDGALKLIELELIEPYLYLAHSQGAGDENRGAQAFAKALRERLIDAP